MPEEPEGHHRAPVQRDDGLGPLAGVAVEDERQVVAFRRPGECRHEPPIQGDVLLHLPAAPGERPGPPPGIGDADRPWDPEAVRGGDDDHLRRGRREAPTDLLERLPRPHPALGVVAHLGDEREAVGHDGGADNP